MKPKHGRRDAMSSTRELTGSLPPRMLASNSNVSTHNFTSDRVLGECAWKPLSYEVQVAVGVPLHFLPPYSLELQPVERLLITTVGWVAIMAITRLKALSPHPFRQRAFHKTPHTSLVIKRGLRRTCFTASRNSCFR